MGHTTLEQAKTVLSEASEATCMKKSQTAETQYNLADNYTLVPSRNFRQCS